MDEEMIKLQSFIDTYLSDRRTIKVLEAGCGSSSYFSMPENSYVVGIDISEAELQKNTVVDEKLLGDIQTYPLPPSEFDVIICWWVMEHLSDPQKALNNFLQSLKEDGIIILGIPNVFSIKGLITKFTPYWFHKWAHKTFTSFMSFEGYVPFRTYLKFSISPKAISRYASRNGLSIAYSSLYEPQGLRNFRKKYKLINITWQLIRRTVKVLSFGKIDLGLSEFIVVLKKQKVPATTHQTPPGLHSQNGALTRTK